MNKIEFLLYAINFLLIFSFGVILTTIFKTDIIKCMLWIVILEPLFYGMSMEVSNRLAKKTSN